VLEVDTGKGTCAAATLFGTTIAQASRTSARSSVSSMASRCTRTQLYRRSEGRGITNFCGSGIDERVPHLPGESESHQRLICGEGKVDDSPDAKLDAPPDQRLVAARQTESHLASRVHRCHCASRIPPRGADRPVFEKPPGIAPD
jgi:hypothetical protein